MASSKQQGIIRSVQALSDYPHIDGSNLLTGHMTDMQRDTYGFYLRHHRTHGQNLRFDAYAGINFYSFSAPDAIQHILIKGRERYSRGKRWSTIVAAIGGKGIVTTEGARWQQQRALVTPYFQPARTGIHAPTIVRNTRELAARAASHNAPVNMSRLMMELSLINVSDILFNYDIRPHAAAFSSAMMDGFTYINRFIQNPLTLPMFLPTKSNRDFRRNKAQADTSVRDIIARVKQDDRDSMINALVRAGNSQQQLHDEIMTLLMAGHDTLSTALAWAWDLLARHPDVAARAIDEVDRVLGGRDATSEDVEQLPYVHSIIKETLRLYPSAWAIHRFSEQPDVVCGHSVRRGSSVVIPVYVTHRDARYWQKPDAFFPDHFDDAHSADRPRFAYIPFGAGPHVCVGGHLAMVESVLILATLLQMFTPSIPQGAQVQPVVNFTLKPAMDLSHVLLKRAK